MDIAAHSYAHSYAGTYQYQYCDGDLDMDPCSDVYFHPDGFDYGDSVAFAHRFAFGYAV